MTLDSLSSDVALRVEQGDRAAEEELSRHFRPRIQCFVQARTRDVALADDLSQEVLLAVIRALRHGQYRHDGSLAAFVYGVARNLLGSAIREKSRRRMESLDDLAVPMACPADAIDEERRADLRRAVEELDEHERTVVALLLTEGCSPEEVAQRLGITQDAVRQRKSRALRRLTARLNPRSQLAARILPMKRDYRERP